MEARITRSIVSCASGIALFSALTLAPAPAVAQPRENPLERARHHMELGQDAFAKERFDEAARQFIDAYGASPFPAFLYNAALAHEQAGNRATAAELYRRYLTEEPGASDAAEVEFKIRLLLAESATGTEAGETSPGVPAVEITEVEMKSLISVRTNPPDARIRLLDPAGRPVAAFEGPTGRTVMRGTYAIEVSHPDFRTVQTEIHITPGQVYIVVVEMSQGAFLGFLHLKTDVPGADVYLDDRSMGRVGTTPWGNVLPAGAHRVWIEKPGYDTIEEEIQIVLGGRENREYSLTRLDFGSVLVKANIPGARVYLDDELLGAAPLTGRAAPGRRRLRVAAEGMKDYTSEITVSRGQVTKALVRMNPTPSRTSAWVSLGFSVALFAGGGVTGGFALKINNELEHERNAGRLADDDPRILKGFLLALGADVGFGVGAIVGALSIYYFLRDPLPPSEGKLYDPVDFESNPDAAVAEAEAEPATGPAARGCRFAVVPLVSANSTGLGLALAF
jgi:tetratricopeptide (TPR) repeat protein